MEIQYRLSNEDCHRHEVDLKSVVARGTVIEKALQLDADVRFGMHAHFGRSGAIVIFPGHARAAIVAGGSHALFKSGSFRYVVRPRRQPACASSKCAVWLSCFWSVRPPVLFSGNLEFDHADRASPRM